MALAESIEYDKIEVVGPYKLVQVRKATVIKKDGEELTRSFERYVLDPGTLNDKDELVARDVSKEPAEVSGISLSSGYNNIYGRIDYQQSNLQLLITDGVSHGTLTAGSGTTLNSNHTLRTSFTYQTA